MCSLIILTHAGVERGRAQGDNGDASHLASHLACTLSSREDLARSIALLSSILRTTLFHFTHNTVCVRHHAGVLTRRVKPVHGFTFGQYNQQDRWCSILVTRREGSLYTTCGKRCHIVWPVWRLIYHGGLHVHNVARYVSRRCGRGTRLFDP